MNTQPWNVYHYHRRTAGRIRAVNTERMVAGIPQSCEFPSRSGLSGKHRDKGRSMSQATFLRMGIDRYNKDKRQDWLASRLLSFERAAS